METELNAARERAEAELRKAEALIQAEVTDNGGDYPRYADTYAERWIRQAAELAKAMERQEPARACPTLLENWQNADVDLILEDWRAFVERSARP